MTRDQKIEKAADALIAEIKDFHCPAEDWERDSYRLLAATVIDAIEGPTARIVK
jgi:hypothetical protein